MGFLTDVEDSLLTVLNTEMDLDFYPDYSNQMEPSGEYASLGVTLLNKLHRDAHNFYETDEGFEERLRQDYNILLTLRFYGNSCYENAVEAQARLSMINTIDALHYFDNISIIDVSTIRRIPEIRPDGYVDKASFDLTVLSGFEYIKSVDWFDTVSYSGEYLNEEGEVILTDSATVSVNDPQP